MNRIHQLASLESVKKALQNFHDDLQKHVDLIIKIQQIPAPTFAEGARADFVEDFFQRLQLSEIEQDELGNVYGRLAGTNPALNPLIVSAHTDTVFPIDTDLTVSRHGQKIYGPGIADNSAGVAGLLLLAETLKRNELMPAADIWFVANIAEEGLGDLKGMRAVTERFGAAGAYIVLEGGSLGHIVHRAIGVSRFRVEVRAQGGHSWADFGRSSAIHIAGQLVAQIAELEVPKEPKTAYNVGVIEGGQSINSIAERASFLLDLRSEGPDELARLVETVYEIVDSHHNPPVAAVEIRQIGNRPAGEVDPNVPLIRWTAQALERVGCTQIEYGASSTDANIPLSKGYMAVCIGLAQSGNVHRLNEYLNPTHFHRGLGQLLLLTLAAGAYEI